MDTAWCHIDVKNGKLSVNVGGDHVDFNLSRAYKCPSISDDCRSIDVINNFVREEVANHVFNDPLEHFLLRDGTSKDMNPKVAMCA